MTTRGHEPVRTCVGCRSRAPKSDLVRVVASRDQAGTVRLVLDPHGRLPGRGAHVHPAPECVDRATRRRAFVRALRLDGPCDPEPLRAEIDSLLHALPPTGHGTTDHPGHQR